MKNVIAPCSRTKALIKTCAVIKRYRENYKKKAGKSDLILNRSVSVIRASTSRSL